MKLFGDIALQSGRVRENWIWLPLIANIIWRYWCVRRKKLQKNDPK